MGLLDTSRKYAEMSGRRELTVTDCTLALDNKGVELEDLNVSIVDHCDRRRQLHGPSSLPERLAAFLDKQTNPPPMYVNALLQVFLTHFVKIQTDAEV